MARQQRDQGGVEGEGGGVRRSCDAANFQLKGIKHRTGTKCKICEKVSKSRYELCKHIRWHSMNSHIATPVKKGLTVRQF